MNRKHLLVHASVLALTTLGLSAPAGAMMIEDDVQEQTPAAKKRQEDERRAKAKAAALVPAADVDPGDVIVTGVRSSLARAREKKRNSDSIVDVVEADDIGKLPNNTIGDVVASIPGISVFRTEGEVNDIQLRGLDGVQTTLSGTPIESGADRVASIADLPADLVQSVEVYKTRSPDQVEGSGAGTININLRKPVDFKDGFFFSGNASGRYNNQSRRVNQVYTAIVNYRKDTGIGNVGVQMGFTVNHNPFLESQARNDPLVQVPTRQVVGPQILPLPTFAPSQVAFFYTTGSRTTPTFNGALQWAPDSETSLLLESNYSRPKFDRFTNQLFVPVLLQAGSTNNLPQLSNTVLVPGTNRLASVTVSPVTQVGPIAFLTEDNNSNFLVKLSAQRKTAMVDFSAEFAYTGGNNHRSEIETRNRFVNRPTYDVEFASDKFRFPMMNLEFRDLNLLDPAQYRFFGLNERDNRSRNRVFSTRADVTLRTGWDPIAYLKVGMRFADRHASRDERLRTVSGLQIEPRLLPAGFNTLVPIAKGFGGTGVQNNARWLSYDRAAVRENYEQMRQFLAPLDSEFVDRALPDIPNRNFEGREQTVAAYATIGYKTNILLPIDGIIGARITNTAVENRSFLFRTVTRTINGASRTITELETRPGSGNYLNIEPTATMVVHLTPKLQTRLSYSVGIRRPTTDQISPFIILNSSNNFFDAGNPDLQPEKTTRFDGSIEYYFGRTGIITVNPFYWKLNGSIGSFNVLELLDESDPSPSVVRRPFNAGNGYRRGVEVQAQTFFTFLPGIIKNFGFSANYTHVDSLQRFSGFVGAVSATPATLPLRRVARHVYNVAGLFERGTLNARVSYNFNGAVLDEVSQPVVRNSTYIAPRDWMDAAINYSIPNGPLRNLGFSIQVQNLLASTRRSFYGFPDQPRDVIYMARTIGGTVRYKF